MKSENELLIITLLMLCFQLHTNVDHIMNREQIRIWKKLHALSEGAITVFTWPSYRKPRKH
jgi:hypothetical protein